MGRSGRQAGLVEFVQVAQVGVGCVGVLADECLLVGGLHVWQQAGGGLLLVSGDGVRGHACVGLGADDLVGGLEARLLHLSRLGFGLCSGQELRRGLAWPAHAVFQRFVHDVSGHVVAFSGGLES